MNATSPAQFARRPFRFAKAAVVAFGFAAICHGAGFPRFAAVPNNPVLRYGDGFADAAWNDPCVLRISANSYVMYASAAVGITGSTPVKIYRLVSPDGNSWTLDPQEPVLDPASFGMPKGGAETPSVVVRNNVFHMYFTGYPENVAQKFFVGHAVSGDGISWIPDAQPVLIPSGKPNWYGSIVGEPGAVIVHDSIQLFFSGAGTENGASIQEIGSMKSPDGTVFSLPLPEVSLPTNVYPPNDGYFGLSTPSALVVGDSLLLFTDVAREIQGAWTQVALHQFKRAIDGATWIADTAPIHRQEDFPWTNGNYLSELRSPAALLDGDKFRLWYAGNHVADISGTDTTYHVVVDGSGIHVLPDHWGIGLSEAPWNSTSSVRPRTGRSVSLHRAKEGYGLDAEDGSTISEWSIIDTKGARLSRGTGPLVPTSLVTKHRSIRFLDLRTSGGTRQILPLPLF